MSINHYESVVIINAALEDEQIEGVVNRIKDFIETNGGTITDLEKWGRKRLAYAIQKSKSGFYAVYRFKAPTEVIAILERSFRLDETVVRFLTIVLSPKDLEHIKKIKAKRDDAKAEASDTGSEASSGKTESQENTTK